MDGVRRGLAAALVLATAGLPGAARAEDPIAVIAAFSLTGGEAVLDLPSYNGAVLAAEAINAKGGVLGRPIALVTVDTESRPDLVDAKIAAALAANPGAVAGIGYTYSTETLDAGKLFQEKGLPFISPGATDPRLPDEVGDNLFLAAYGDDAQAAAMAAFARKELGASTTALWIDESRIYTRTVGTDFADSFRKLGGDIVLARSDRDPAGFPAFVEALKTAPAAPDVIYVASLPEPAPGFIAALRAAGIKAPLLSGDGWDADTILAASKAEAIGDIYFTTHRFIGVDTAEMKAFVEAYTKRFGAAPQNAFAPLGFDTVNLLADAIERAGSADPAAIRTALAATRGFNGVVGPISYAPGVRVPKKEVAVIAVDKGAATLRWVAPAE